MNRINDVTRDCFNALIQVRQLDEASLPSVDVLRSRLRGFIDALFQRAQQAGFNREEVNDIAYAVVALADECVMGKSDSIREAWGQQPLQLQYFQELVAGEAFFTRLETLRKDPRKSELLHAYYLALLFGFEGQYRVNGKGSELINLVESIGRELGQSGRGEYDTLSPHAERPPEPLVPQSGGGKLALAIGAGMLALAMVFFFGLRISVGMSTDGVVNRISAIQLP